MNKDYKPILPPYKWVTIKATGEQGQVWESTDKAAFVCVPNVTSNTGKFYTLEELSTT